MMPTIFITISDGEVAKNILETDIFPLLKKEAHIVLFVNPHSVNYFSHLADGESVFVESMPNAPYPWSEKFFSDLFLYSLHTESIRVKIEYSYQSGGSRLGKWIKLMLWYMGRWYPYRRLCRFLYRILPERAFDAYFEKYKPSLIFVANLTSAEDARLLKGATRRGVKSIGMPKGWDNLTLKTFLPVFPDKLLVETPLMKGDAQALDYPSEQIFVTGFPKFDVYAGRSLLIPREEFLRKFNFDPSRKLILYAGAGDQLAPHDEEILTEFLEAIARGDIADKPNVLVRPHPKYKYRADILPERPFWVLDRPGKQLAGSNFVFEKDDIVHLMNSLYHCDLLIHTASTLGIEAAIFDKPSITISYDGAVSKPAGASVARYYRYVHLARVLATGGMRVARNFGELQEFTNTYLADPALDRAGRHVVVEENAYHIDGKAGERVAGEIIAMLKI